MYAIRLPKLVRWMTAIADRRLRFNLNNTNSHIYTMNKRRAQHEDCVYAIIIRKTTQGLMSLTDRMESMGMQGWTKRASTKV